MSGAGWVLAANSVSIASSGSGFTVNVWHHVAVVYEFQVFRVFINGISYVFWIKGLQFFDASKVAPFTFIIPILSAFFLILVFYSL
jgi:drug/metabolite transporter (DMT)-like permease